MWVKFCGITRIEDALFARDLGADAIGFIFAPSPRQVTVEQVQEITSRVDGITKVGVFVNESVEMVERTRDLCHLDLVQLHGEESPEYCKHFAHGCTKAFRIKSAEDLAELDSYPMTWKNLIDAFVPNKQGGTGKTIDANVLREIGNPEQIILAGGLNPDNIEKILKVIKPFGLDVSSGVEQSPGIKNHEKMRLFINQLKLFETK